MTATLKLHSTTLALSHEEALRAYPEEGCGFVLRNPKTGAERFVRVDNIQNALHAKDPERFTRTAATAYSIDPKVQEKIFKEASAAGEEIIAIFHSHPDHDAYFSAEDKMNAAPWGEPLLPGLAYLVVSVYKGAVRDTKTYGWCPEKADFVELT